MSSFGFRNFFKTHYHASIFTLHDLPILIWNACTYRSYCISLLLSLIWKNWKDCIKQRTSSSQLFWIFTFICMLFIDCSIHSLNRLHVFKSSILTGRRDCNRWTPSLLHGPCGPLVWGRPGQWWLWGNRGAFTWKAKPSRRNSKSTFISFIILNIFLGLEPV